MLYMPDCLRATTELMECDDAKLKHRVYNLGAFSLTPAEQAASIKKYISEFEIEYKPDFRQNIAQSLSIVLSLSSLLNALIVNFCFVLFVF